jgi:hypothetical protein
MRCVFLHLVIVSLLLLWSAGCSYSVDRSKICEDGDVTEEGYGLACTTDEECSANPTEGDMGATQCSTLDKLVVMEIPDGGSDGGMPPGDAPPGDVPQDTGDAGSELDDFLEMLEPMINICTNMACEQGGCPVCYQCCECDMAVTDAMEMFGVSVDGMDQLLENTKLDFAACVPVSSAEILAMICTCS